MRRPQGYAIWTGPEGPPVEQDTFTCVHCNTVVFVTPKTPLEDLGGWCGMCSKPVCKHCAGKGCTPFEKRLEEIERRERLLQQIGV